MSKYLVIVDYNLTRFHDVKLMTDYAKSRYQAETILLRPNPQPCDREVATVIGDLDPRAADFIPKALQFLAPYCSGISAVLPFSDNGVVSGATLAGHLGMKSDSALLARNAYSKLSYREAEDRLRHYLEAQEIFVPRFARVSTRTELEAFADLCPNGFVLKPSCEGNNRGVLRLEKGCDLRAAFDEVEMYLKEGLICEELIPFDREYSFDGIGHLTFATEKMSVTGRYPVEKGQIVPARLSSDRLQSIERAGRAANLLVGQRIGPFHNEIKLDFSGTRSAVIEPNRRPAGMRIWHLAEKVYGVNFFKLWIDQLLGEGIPTTLPAPKGVAAILELAAPFNGTLSPAIDDPNFSGELLRKLLRDSPKGLMWSDFRFTQRGGTLVNREPRDNSGFIAEICVFSDDPLADIREIGSRFEERFKESMREHMHFPEMELA